MTEAAKSGPGMMLFVLLLLFFMAMGALHYYKVHIPYMKNQLKQQELLTAAITAITPVLTETKDLSEHTKADVMHIKLQVKLLIKAYRVKIKALRKMAQEVGLDISEELGEMSGILHDEED